MAYEVTATLRRPQLFDALVGQEFVSKALKSSIENGKIAHAYLFAGPRGCGKTSTARILAKSLNCDKGPTATPCGECTHCREITAGSSLDVIEIDGASNTSVNDVRQIKDEVMFPPNSSRYKVYIIDEVHMLSTSAFNALLKTIEEPPPHVVFIFATTETQKVPATIKSRCQQFNFRLVSIDDVAALLKAAAKDAGIEADDEALYWVARQGGGSVRDAYTLFDQVSSFSEGHITYDKIKSHLGLVGVDRLGEIFEYCAAGRAGDAIEAVNRAIQDGVSIEQLVIDSASYMRSILLIKSGVTKDSLLGEAAGRYSQAVLNAWSTAQVERALSLLLQLYRDIRYSLSGKYEVELAISRLSWLKDYVPPSEVKAAIDAVRPLLVGTAPAPSQAAAYPYQSVLNRTQETEYSYQNAPYKTQANSSSTSSGAPAEGGGQPSGGGYANGGGYPAQGGGAVGASEQSAPSVPSAQSEVPAPSAQNTHVGLPMFSALKKAGGAGPFESAPVRTDGGIMDGTRAGGAVPSGDSRIGEDISSGSHLAGDAIQSGSPQAEDAASRGTYTASAYNVLGDGNPSVPQWGGAYYETAGAGEDMDNAGDVTARGGAPSASSGAPSISAPAMQGAKMPPPGVHGSTEDIASGMGESEAGEGDISGSISSKGEASNSISGGGGESGASSLETPPQDLPREVRILRDMFRGTVSVTKHS